jgi:hypothetical protein
MNQLNVPWDKIKESVEAGMPVVKVANLFSIKPDTIKQRSLREKWYTPRRKAAALKKEIEEQGNRVPGPQRQMVIANAIMEEQMNNRTSAASLSSTSSSVDFDTATKDYRSKGVLKMAKILDATVIAPPRSWKDYDIADKMMRRLLGIDEQEGRSNTIVQLQVVNDRLRSTMQNDILEGEMIDESVTQESREEDLQRELTGCQPETPL